MICPDQFSKLPLKGGHLRPLRYPTGEHGLVSRLSFGLFQYWHRNGDHEARASRSLARTAECRSARHQFTNSRKPVWSGIPAWNPSKCLALSVDARRRGTGFTDLSGANSGTSPVRPITIASACASCARLVSVPLATLNTSSLASELAPKILAR